MLKNHPLETILSGETNIDELPLTLQFVVQRVTERFREYGNLNYQKRSGRETDPLSRKSRTEGSREVRTGSEKEPGTAGNGSIGASASRFLDDVVTRTKQVPITETKTFRDWFGDNKIVDENVELLKIYHGTNISAEYYEEDPDMYKLVSKAIESLGNPCKELLELYYFENHSWETVASLMGYSSAASARNQKYKCLEKIREQVSRKQQ